MVDNNTDIPEVSSINDGDVAWILASSALVMLMTPGISFFYGGLVKRDSVVNTIMMALISLGLISIHWVIFGYSFAFGPGNQVYGSEKFIGMRGVGREPNPIYAATIPHSLFCVYQMMFASITTAIISGGMVERVKFGTFLVFLICWTTLVYDMVAHWIWSAYTEIDASTGEEIVKYGWLRQLGSLDFAGGTAVHISSGVSSLVASSILPVREHKAMKHKADNVGWVILGTALLWFGWFGFNAGSALAGDGLAAQAFITTQTAASTGFFTWVVLDFFIKKKVKPVGAACGAVIGLVAITPAAGFVHTPSALAFGVLPVIIIYFWLMVRSKYLAQYFTGEDTLDVFAAHGMGGIIGCLMLAFFASTEINSFGTDGIFFGGDGKLLGYQIAAIVTVSAYSALVTFILLMVLKYTIGLAYEREILDKIDERAHGIFLSSRGIKPKDAVTNLEELKVQQTPTSRTENGVVEEPEDDNNDNDDNDDDKNGESESSENGKDHENGKVNDNEINMH